MRHKEKVNSLKKSNKTAQSKTTKKAVPFYRQEINYMEVPWHMRPAYDPNSFQ